MQTAIFLIMSVVHLVFLVMAVRLYGRTRSIYTGLTCLILFGLFYDNFIIGIGSFIGEGDFLLALNWPRFAIHALLTPLLILFALDIARRANLKWAHSSTVMLVFGVLTLLMIALGVYTDIIDLALELMKEGGTVRYVNGNAAGPPVPAIVTILVLIGVGIPIWRQSKWSLLCLGSLFMFVAAGAGASLPVVGNLGEVVLSGTIVKTDEKFS